MVFKHVTKITATHATVSKTDTVKTSECNCKTAVVTQINEVPFTPAPQICIEELLRTIKPRISFLHGHAVKKRIKTEEKTNSYLAMDLSPENIKEFFSFSYDYPTFDWNKLRFSKIEVFNDRGYYAVENETKGTKRTENPKCKSTPISQELIDNENLYEDLSMNYELDRNRSKSAANVKRRDSNSKSSVLQDLMTSFRNTFSKKTESAKTDLDKVEKVCEKKEDVEDVKYDDNIYESTENCVYDTIDNIKKGHVDPQSIVPVEDYMVPILIDEHYSDVNNRGSGNSFLSYLIKLFTSAPRRRKETSEKHFADDLEKLEKQQCAGASDVGSKWNTIGDRKTARHNMAERPLPVPMDQVPYFMELDRREAEELLIGQPDGTFVLRPSSQPTHVYTLSVSCAGAVHNVGIRRRTDGMFALGFSRTGEKTYPSIAELIRTHQRCRLQLMAPGGVLGATALTEPPALYQSPSNIPVYCDATLEKC